MSRKVRLWGGPACGKLETVEEGQSSVRVILRPKFRMEDMNRSIEMMRVDVVEYQAADYRDSQGHQVFLYPKPGEYLLQHFDEMRSEAHMNFYIKPVALMVPRMIWRELEREYMTTAARWCEITPLNGEISFRGLKVIFGDETKMLTKLPEPPRFPSYHFGPTLTRGEIEDGRAEMDGEAWRAQYEGEWPTPMLQPYQRQLAEAYERGERPIALRSRNTGMRTVTEVMMEMRSQSAHLDMIQSMEREMHRQTGVPEDIACPRPPVHVPGDRRNRTTVHSSDGRGPFRIVIENGRHLDQARKDRLYMQYRQALTNRNLQYVENSDLL